MHRGGVHGCTGGGASVHRVLRRNVIETKTNHDSAGVNSAGEAGTPTAFAEFWARYPRRESKIQAQSTFKKFVKAKVGAERIMAALEKSIRGWAAAKTEKHYLPHASSWLNKQLWEDDPADDEKTPWSEPEHPPTVYSTPAPSAYVQTMTPLRQRWIDAMAESNDQPLSDEEGQALIAELLKK